MLQSATPVLLGFPWLTLGALKALDPQRFLLFVETMLGRGAPTAAVAAWTAILVELLLGAGLILRGGGVLGRVLALASLAGGAAALVLASTSGGDGAQGCGCFGAVAEATNGRRMVVAAALVFLSCEILRRPSRKNPVVGEGGGA